MYKLNKDLINRMKKENELKNSTEERDMIKNKLLLLQNFMESGDISLSKNNQVKNLLQKFQTSEETTMEDIKNLNSFVKEGKKNLNKKPINLKDDYDEQEDQNNNDNQNNPLSRSNIFEKGLRIGKNINDNNIPKKNFGRTSFTDLKLQFQNNKDKDEDKAKEGDKKINSNEQKIIEDKKGTSDIDNIVNNKFSNINIDKEYSNNNNKYNNLSTRNPEEIKEEIEENQSSYQAKVINNFEVYIATVLDSLPAKQAEKGKNVLITLSSGEEINATIYYTKVQEKGKVLIIFKVNFFYYIWIL